MRLRFLLISAFYFLGVFTSFSQSMNLSGKVLDSISNKHLVYANILAVPEDDNHDIAFAITSQNGDYVLSLSQNTLYNVTISYLGYFPKNFKLSTTNENIKKDYFLNKSTTELDEVIIHYKVPIEVKEDTIIYDVDAFISGEERKLRDVLKKLPGVEVDREGNIEVRGKKITKILVEDKTFFTGNSKLAVDNIPADVIDRIEVLDNYNSVGFLKGLQDSDQMAMNIQLKKDKKKFIFGELETGLGLENRYTIHPTLFYYSPNTNINIIGDLNNIGEKSFTFRDYIEFEGGFSKILTDIGSYANLANDDFAKYLRNNDFKSNVDKFGAFNIRQSINEKTDLNGYVISNSSKTETETSQINNYLNNDNPFIENRKQQKELNNFFIIGKVSLEYNPTKTENLSSHSLLKLTNNDIAGNINTNSPFNNSLIETNEDLKSRNFKQSLAYNKKLSNTQTLSMEVFFENSKNTPLTNWFTNGVFFENFIPVLEDMEYDISQKKQFSNSTFHLLGKDYWVLNKFNHIYTSIGTQLIREDFITNENQIITDGEINNFTENGFGNEVRYSLNDFFLGLEYKFLKDIFTFKPAVFYHLYRWNNSQPDNNFSSATNVVLPELKVEAKFNSSEKLSFNYKQKVRFPNSNRLINNFTLTSFDRIFRGNQSLSNERFHTYSLVYTKFSLFRGLTINANIFYNKKTQSIKNTTEIEGINKLTTLIIFNSPEDNISGGLNFSKKIKKIKLSLRARGNYSEFFQIVNSITSKNISKGFSGTGKIETSFKKLPNFEIGYTLEPTSYRSLTSKSNFKNEIFFANLSYDFFNDFQLKADYARTRFENKDIGVKNVFDFANTSLFYQKEGSRWGFEVSATNLFNTEFRRESSLNDFLISDRRTLILPRILLFKISYKL